jgi:hypothetical protein
VNIPGNSGKIKMGILGYPREDKMGISREIKGKIKWESWDIPERWEFPCNFEEK